MQSCIDLLNSGIHEPQAAVCMAGTPSSSSSYDTAADHVIEGLLCPDSIDAMRKWAVSG